MVAVRSLSGVTFRCGTSVDLAWPGSLRWVVCVSPMPVRLVLELAVTAISNPHAVPTALSVHSIASLVVLGGPWWSLVEEAL